MSSSSLVSMDDVFLVFIYVLFVFFTEKYFTLFLCVNNRPDKFVNDYGKDSPDA